MPKGRFGSWFGKKLKNKLKNTVGQGSNDNITKVGSSICTVAIRPLNDEEKECLELSDNSENKTCSDNKEVTMVRRYIQKGVEDDFGKKDRELSEGKSNIYADSSPSRNSVNLIDSGKSGCKENNRKGYIDRIQEKRKQQYYKQKYHSQNDPLDFLSSDKQSKASKESCISRNQKHKDNPNFKLCRNEVVDIPQSSRNVTPDKQIKTESFILKNSTELNKQGKKCCGRKTQVQDAFDLILPDKHSKASKATFISKNENEFEVMSAKPEKKRCSKKISPIKIDHTKLDARDPLVQSDHVEAKLPKNGYSRKIHSHNDYAQTIPNVHTNYIQTIPSIHADFVQIIPQRASLSHHQDDFLNRSLKELFYQPEEKISSYRSNRHGRSLKEKGSRQGMSFNKNRERQAHKAKYKQILADILVEDFKKKTKGKKYQDESLEEDSDYSFRKCKQSCKLKRHAVGLVEDSEDDRKYKQPRRTKSRHKAIIVKSNDDRKFKKSSKTKKFKPRGGSILDMLSISSILSDKNLGHMKKGTSTHSKSSWRRGSITDASRSKHPNRKKKYKETYRLKRQKESDTTSLEEVETITSDGDSSLILYHPKSVSKSQKKSLNEIETGPILTTLTPAQQPSIVYMDLIMKFIALTLTIFASGFYIKQLLYPEDSSFFNFL